MTRSARLLAGAALCALAFQAAAATEKVGVSSAVNPATSSVPPDAPMRTLYLGADIVFNERIVTEGAGQAQILFLDQSAFTVGPDSDVVIDNHHHRTWRRHRSRRRFGCGARCRRRQRVRGAIRKQRHRGNLARLAPGFPA